MAKYVVTQPGLAKPRKKGKFCGEYEVGAVVDMTDAQAGRAVNKVRPVDAAEAGARAEAKDLAALQKEVSGLSQQLADAQAANAAQADQLAAALSRVAELETAGK